MTENDLLNELRNEMYVPGIEEGEITASMLATELNIGERAAMYRLKKLEKRGILTSRWVRFTNQAQGWAFKKKELPKK